MVVRLTLASEQARRDEGFMVKTDDPAMQAAYRRGRETLSQFLAINDNRPPNSRAYAVKIPVRDAGKVEWFRIADFARSGDRFSGTIAKTPRFTSACSH